MQRSDEKLAELTEDEIATEPEEAAGSDTADSGRLGNVFSLKGFLLSAVLIAVGVVGGGMIPLVGTVGSLVGLFAVTFVLGVVATDSHYLETALAGGGIMGASFAASLITTVALPIGLDFFQQYGLVFAAVGVAIGAVLAAAGHYFGRDLRDGLTRSVDS